MFKTSFVRLDTPDIRSTFQKSKKKNILNPTNVYSVKVLLGTFQQGEGVSWEYQCLLMSQLVNSTEQIFFVTNTSGGPICGAREDIIINLQIFKFSTIV